MWWNSDSLTHFTSKITFRYFQSNLNTLFLFFITFRWPQIQFFRKFCGVNNSLKVRFIAPHWQNSFPPSQSQDPQICDIASSSNIFENLKFSKMFDDSMLRIRGSCSCDWEGWRLEWWKLRQKNWRLRSRPAFLWHLPTFSRTGWRSRSASFDMIQSFGLSSTPGFLSLSTRPLGQAAHQFGRATCSVDAA